MRSLRSTLLLVMLGLIIALVTILTSIQITSQRRLLERQNGRQIEIMKRSLIERGQTLTDIIARQVTNDIASFNFSNLSQVLNAAVDDDVDLEYAIMMDSSQVAYVHTENPLLVNKTLNAASDIFAAGCRRQAINEYQTGDQSFIEIIQPIDFNNQLWGCVRLGFSPARLNAEIVRSQTEIDGQIRTLMTRSLLTSLVFIAVGLGIVWLISDRLSRPIVRLTDSARELAAGNFTAIDDPGIKTNNEIGILADTFVEMSNELRTSYRNLEATVAERTQQLRQRNEELETLNRDKNEFLAIAAHDLKNPLSTIHTFANSIHEELNGQADGIPGRYAEIIARKSGRMFNLIRNLLDINAIESGKLNLTPRPLPMADLVRDAVNEYASRAGEKNIELTLLLEAENACVVTDRNALMQVLDNLISNAVKFSPSGKTVTVRLFIDGTDVCCTVADEGPGFTDEDRKRLFGKFARLRAQPTGGEESSGLGLFIAKKLVEEMNGRITCTSQVGRGAAFTVAFPAVGEDVVCG